MKKGKALRIIGIILILTLMITACSNKEASTTTDNKSVSYDVSMSDYAYEDTSKSKSGTTEPVAAGEGLSNTSSITTDNSSVQSQDKIIRTFYMDVETQTFDDLINRISSEVSRLNGYVENSKISGKRYYYNEEARYGSIVARIPSDKVDEFVNTVNDNANIVNKQESSENVSLKYIEAESRVETLKIEQERLFAILEQEVSLENIITLESRLSDIRYELQNYESQLRYYDNQVAYSTVNLNIQEVEKLTPVTEVKQNVGTRIKNGFSNTMYNLSEGCKDFFVWFVVNLPYLLIWAFIITAFVLIIKKIVKKQDAKSSTLPPSSMTYLGQQNLGQQDLSQPNHNQTNQK